MTQRTVINPLTGATYTDDPTRPLADPPPATPNVSLNGQHEPEDYDALLNDGGYIDPNDIVDVWSAKAITPLLPIIAEYTGDARRVAIEALAGMVGYLPKDERDALELPLLRSLFKAKADLDAFFDRCPPPPGEPVFKLQNLAELFQRPDKVWLIDQVIGAGDIGTIYGAPGCGKTFVSIDLIFAACLRQPWARRFDVLRPLTVVYAAGEGIGGLKERFLAAAKYYNVTDYLPGFSFSDLVPQLFQGGNEAIDQFIAEWQTHQADGGPALDLLIIDTLHSATVGADENSAQDMGQVLAAAKRASKQLGCAVLLDHHTNKGGTAERGSSALRGAMDTMIEIRKISDTGTKAVMCCAKLKDGKEWQEQTFDLVAVDDCESVRIWWDEPGEMLKNAGQKATDKATLKAEMERYAGTRFTVKSLAEVIAKSDNYTRSLLNELEMSAEVKRDLSNPAKGQSPRNPWVYYVESVQEAAEEMGV